MAETIEYCLRNVDGETRRRLVAAADAETGGVADAGTDTAVVERRCLQRCGECYREDFLVVDGALETADSHATLLAAHDVATRGREASDR